MSDQTPETPEYTQGVCKDGAAILKDGQMMTIEEILSELRQAALSHKAEHEPVDVDFIVEVLDDYCQLQRSGHVAPASRYCPSAVNEQIDALQASQSISTTPQPTKVPDGILVDRQVINLMLDYLDDGITYPVISGLRALLYTSQQPNTSAESE